MVAAFRGEGEHAGGSSKQAVAAAVIGNVLEWYDFSVYAFVATTIAKTFFPQGGVARTSQHFPRLRHRLLGTPARRHPDRTLRRRARPQGGPLAHHLPHGIGHGADRRHSQLRLDRLLGPASPGGGAPDAGLLARAENGAGRPPSSSSGRPRSGAASTAVSSNRASWAASCSAPASPHWSARS